MNEQQIAILSTALRAMVDAMAILDDAYLEDGARNIAKVIVNAQTQDRMTDHGEDAVAADLVYALRGDTEHTRTVIDHLRSIVVKD